MSLVGVFEAIGAKTLPHVLDQLFLVVSTVIENNDGEMAFSALISAPSGKALRRNNSPAIGAGDRDRIMYNAVFGFYGLRLEETGEYHIEVFANGQSVHLITLPVNLVQ